VNQLLNATDAQQVLVSTVAAALPAVSVQSGTGVERRPGAQLDLQPPSDAEPVLRRQRTAKRLAAGGVVLTTCSSPVDSSAVRLERRSNR
jgi:hypothetical protein